MEAVFITERIILLSASENVTDAAYRPAVKQLSRQLQSDYGPDRYFIINVSEPRSDLIRLNNHHVMDYGWSSTLAPPLERLCAICKQADAWINADLRHILIIHCKGGLGRAGLVVASYMHYTSICAAPNQALDRYAMKHFFDDELKRHILPSQRRYVQYFSGLLSGLIRMNSEPVYLCTLSILQVANIDGKAGCRPCFKVYQNNEHIWTSEVYSMSEPEERRILTIHLRPALQLRGDILIKCLHHKKLRPDLKDIIFRCQLHTCAIDDGILILNKGDLDEAHNDIRFPDDGRVELTFSRSAASDGPSHFDIQRHERATVDLLDDRSLAEDGRARQISSKCDVLTVSPLTVHGPSLRLVAEQEDLPSFTTSLSSDLQPQSTRSPHHFYGTSEPTYAKVHKRGVSSVASASDQVQGVVCPLDIYRSGDSLDSGIATVPAAVLASSEMDRRSPSPSKSVKFRDVPDHSSLSRTTPAEMQGSSSKLRNGMEVIDLDNIHPDMEELDRVFESLRADTEDLEQQQYKLAHSAGKKDKEITVASAAPEPKYQTDPRRLLENETGAGLRNDLTSPSSAQTGDNYSTAGLESETDTVSTSGQQDGAFIQSYVPQDRKGLGKKYGAFTFGLPTTRPELKPITSPQPRRRDREPPSYHSDHEQEVDKYARNRLRHVDQDSTSVERQRAEERLYNTRAPTSPSPAEKPMTWPAVGSSNNHRDDNASLYGKIAAKPKESPTPTASMVSASPQQSKTQSLPRRVPSPSPPRPRTPTEDERLQRLLNVEQGEFLVDEGAGGDRHRSRLKEIAKEGHHVNQYHEVHDRGSEMSPRILNDKAVSQMESSTDAKMDYEIFQSDLEDASLPERKKMKQEKSVYTQTRSVPSAAQSTAAGMASSGTDSSSWLQKQHDKLMTRRHGGNYTRRRDHEAALLEELRSSQERMIEQVPNRDLDENRLPLSSIILREAKTPPLLRRADDEIMDGRGARENPGYAVVKKQLSRTIGPDGQVVSRRETVTRHESYQSHHPKGISYTEQERVQTYSANKEPASTADLDTDHDSIADEVDFGDEPLYKSPASYRVSRSRDVDGSRVRSVGGSFSNPTSPDQTRRSAAASPKSILKNTSLTRGRYATSEDRAGTGITNTAVSSNRAERPITPNFPPEKERSASLSRNNLLQHRPVAGYSVYGTRDRANNASGNNVSGRSTPTGYFGMGNSRRSSLTSVNQADAEEEVYLIDQDAVFQRDLSKLWYKPGISREETIQILKDKPAGFFLIRDSNSFPGAYGLAVKVDPDHLSNGGKSVQSADDLVRHFLIEPSAKGVHLKGCQNEPVFASLSALVYQHTMTALALPCRLILPQSDMILSHQNIYSEDNLQRLMDQGAACNVFYLLSLDTESLTGPQAIRRTMTHVQHGHPIQPTVVHFKVNAQGIILTDNKRRLFFRRHYPIQAVSFCGLDPDDRRWTYKADPAQAPTSARCFGFISRKAGSYNQNECHLFAELEMEQPAGAIVSFVTKVMMTSVSVEERRAQVAHSHAVDQKAAGPFTSLDSMSLTRQRDGHKSHVK